MAITRTPMVDDDGSGMTGTILNNAWKQEFYNQIDAVTGVDVISISTTGTVNDLALSGTRDLLVRCVNTAALTITGIAGGFDGRRVTFVALNTAPVHFPHYSTGSIAANRLLNVATSGLTSIVPGPGASGVGYCTYQYSTAQALWYLVSHEQGAWITPPYSAADYTAASGTWTVEAGDVTLCAYRLSGRTVSFQMNVTATSVSAASATLGRAIPGGFTVASGINMPCIVTNAGAAATTGIARTIAGAPLAFYADVPGNNWNIATNSTTLHVNITFPVT